MRTHIAEPCEASGKNGLTGRGWSFQLQYCGWKPQPRKYSHFRSPKGPRQFLWALNLAVLALALAGCQRAFYREQADAEAYALIQEKETSPHWTMPRSDIDIDPRSRMFDPFDPDHPPMPPDDPASHELMHHVDHKKGYPHWHGYGDTAYAENPNWYQWLPLNEEGVLVVDAETAVELALLHSRDYQSQLETLYLSALDVSAERFRFDTQFFGGYTTRYHADGPIRGGGESASILGLATFPESRDGIRMSRKFATGADLLVGFANSLVWQFSGPNTYAASSLVDFTLVQPLLRGAGRDKIMETLTRAERGLLANIRQMERFRRGFSLEIVTGVDAGAGPSRSGGVFGAGFEGFTGVGGGGFGGVSGGVSVAGGGGTGGGQAGGLMGLLQTQQQIRNAEDNLLGQQQNYLQLLIGLQEMLTTIPESTETVVRQRLQVAQARQAVLDAESRLINSRVGYQSTLDGFKITLGLPPEICVKIQDDMLDRVKLTDQRFRIIRNQVGDLQLRIGDLILGILPQEEGETLQWTPEVAARLNALKALLDEVEPIRTQLVSGEEAQMLRVRADGLDLGQQLEQILKKAIEKSSGAGSRQLAELRQDADLLGRVMQRVGERENWVEGLRDFNLLRDSLKDISRLHEEMARGTVVNIDWMRTDSNPSTRDAYPRYRDAVDVVNEAADTDRPAAVNQILVQLDQESVPFEQRLQAILDQNPWLSELDRWRARPDEIEEAAASEETILIHRFQRLFAQFIDSIIDTSARFDSLPGKIDNYREQIDALIVDGPNLAPNELIARFRQDISPVIPQELVEFGNDVLNLSLVQSRDRAETVSLVPIDLHPAAALEIAEENRRDWMNNRAALVDQWRLVEWNADDLESTLDIVFDGDMGTRGDDPFKFDASNGRLRVALQFDAPLTRLQERNKYRQTLIEYQRARRSYYAFRDAVARGLRDTIRTLELNERNFEIRRNAVRVADLQIEVNEDIRRLQEANGTPSGPTAARDAIQALDALLRAQDDFLSVWVTYEVLRQTLDFNLGTMELDSDNMWIDPGEMGPDQGYPGIGDVSEFWPGPMVMPTCNSPYADESGDRDWRPSTATEPDQGMLPPVVIEPDQEVLPPVVVESDDALEDSAPGDLRAPLLSPSSVQPDTGSPALPAVVVELDAPEQLAPSEPRALVPPPDNVHLDDGPPELPLLEPGITP